LVGDIEEGKLVRLGVVEALEFVRKATIENAVDDVGVQLFLSFVGRIHLLLFAGRRALLRRFGVLLFESELLGETFLGWLRIPFN